MTNDPLSEPSRTKYNDPVRFDITPSEGNNGDADYPDLHVVRSPYGAWIKYADFIDYRQALRRNKTAELNARLGVEIAELRTRLANLEAMAKKEGGAK